ncbi:MAG: ubiquinol-cytochrome C chaperone family protein [Pseudomonadota bacterium]
MTVPEQIYGMVVARSRDEKFFKEFNVQDTVMGRFDMLALHVYLFSRRMRKEDGTIALSLSQDVFDLFVADIERALRELGIGDTTVPKRKKKMVRSFYGQIEDFDDALDGKDVNMLTSRVSNRYLDEEQPEKARQLAGYMLDMDEKFGEIKFEEFTLGKFGWPPFQSEISA